MTSVDSLVESPDLAHEVYDGLSIELRPAPFWRRTLAFCVDYGILAVFSYVLFLVIGVVFFSVVVGGVSLSKQLGGFMRGVSASLGAMVGVALLLSLVLGVLALYDAYFIYFEYKNGATPGKKLFGMKVVSLRGNRLSLGQCVTREVFRYIDAFLMLPGLISWIATEKRQRIGDLVSGTMVTWSENAEKRDTFMYMNQDGYQYLLEALRPGELTEEQAKWVLGFAYPHYILNTHSDDAGLDKKMLVDFADGLFQEKPQSLLSDDIKIRFVAELSFQKFGIK